MAGQMRHAHIRPEREDRQRREDLRRRRDGNNGAGPSTPEERDEAALRRADLLELAPRPGGPAR